MAHRQVSAQAQIQGAVVLTTLSALGVFQDSARRILAELGIADLLADHWYPQHLYIRFFEALRERTGPAILLRNGRRIAEIVQVPAQIDCLEKLLSAMNGFYRQGRRGCDPEEGWTYERLGPRCARMTIVSPYPDEYEHGVLEGFARKFKPADSPVVRVEHEPGTRPSESGGTATAFIVTW